MEEATEFKNFIKEMSHIPVYLRNVSEDEIMQNPLFFHITKYPSLQCIDIYKFIMQGSCGWFHMSSFGDEKHLKDYQFISILIPFLLSLVNVWLSCHQPYPSLFSFSLFCRF